MKNNNFTSIKKGRQGLVKKQKKVKNTKTKRNEIREEN